MLIHIVRPPDAHGIRVEDDVPDTDLVQTTGATDTDYEHTTWVEYRLPDSDVIVHRSVHVVLKKWPDGTDLTGLTATFGKSL